MICRHLDDGGDARDAPPDVALEVVAGPAEQGLHGLAAVVAGDVGVEVLPDALDAVRVGAVGRQEVQDDAAAELFESALRDAGGVDAVVVDDEVDPSRAGYVVARSWSISQNRAAFFFAAPVVCNAPVRTSTAPAR